MNMQHHTKTNVKEEFVIDSKESDFSIPLDFLSNDSPSVGENKYMDFNNNRSFKDDDDIVDNYERQKPSDNEQWNEYKNDENEYKRDEDNDQSEKNGEDFKKDDSRYNNSKEQEMDEERRKLKIKELEEYLTQVDVMVEEEEVEKESAFARYTRTRGNGTGGGGGHAEEEKYGNDDSYVLTNTFGSGAGAAEEEEETWFETEDQVERMKLEHMRRKDEFLNRKQEILDNQSINSSGGGKIGETLWNEYLQEEGFQPSSAYERYQGMLVEDEESNGGDEGDAIMKGMARIEHLDKLLAAKERESNEV